MRWRSIPFHFDRDPEKVGILPTESGIDEVPTHLPCANLNFPHHSSYRWNRLRYGESQNKSSKPNSKMFQKYLLVYVENAWQYYSAAWREEAFFDTYWYSY